MLWEGSCMAVLGVQGGDEGYPGRESPSRVVLRDILECKAGRSRIEVLSQKKEQPVQQVEGEHASSSRTYF